MIWVFGWGGGKSLVQGSYEEAKAKADEQKAKKAAAAAAEAARQRDLPDPPS